MLTFLEKFSALESTTFQIVELLKSEKLDEVNALLRERQKDLVALDTFIKEQGIEGDVLMSYQKCLMKIKKIDDQQINLLMQTKKELLALSSKQNKTNAAISVYSNVKSN